MARNKKTRTGAPLRVITGGKIAPRVYGTVTKEVPVGTQQCELPPVTEINDEAEMLRSWKSAGAVWGVHPLGVYRRVMGGLEGWVPAAKELVTLHPHKGVPKLTKVRNDFRPTPGQLRFVFDMVFCKDNVCHEHETMVVFGKDKETGVLRIFVPKQRVARANVVAIKEDGGVTAFAEKHHVIGDMHSHPWQGLPSASGTDNRSMEEQAGIYAIVSAGGEVQWYASSSGCVTAADVWRLATVKAEPIDVWSVDGKPIKEMFIRETYAQVGFHQKLVSDDDSQWYQQFMKQWNESGSPPRDNESNTYEVNGVTYTSGRPTNSSYGNSYKPQLTKKATARDIEFRGWSWNDLVMIRIDGETLVVTANQWKMYQEEWMPHIDDVRMGKTCRLLWEGKK